LALLAIAGCGGSDQPKSTVCTDAGCLSGFQVSAPHVALDRQQILGSTLVACRNGACIRHPLADWDGRSLTHLPDPPQTDYVQLGIVEEMGGVHLEIFYTVITGRTLPDGDVYDVTLTTADGATPIAVHRVATYMRFQPNGPACDPTCYNDF